MPAPPAEILIGATLPLTGSDAAVGLAARRGYEHAVAEQHAEGGVHLGADGPVARVRLDLRDDRSETPRAEQLVGALLDAGAHVVIATPNAVRATAQAEVAERAGRLLIVNATDGSGLPGPKMRWVVSIPADEDVEMRAYWTLRTLLTAIATAGTVDNAAVRLLLGERLSQWR